MATKPDKPVDEMHNVYARPEDVQAYRRDGKFPDGAMLVKDITTCRLGEAHHGAVHLDQRHQDLVRDGQGLEGAVPRQRPVGRRLGLGLVRGEGPEDNVATDYTTDCKLCHVPAKKDDWVYIRGYPVLKK